MKKIITIVCLLTTLLQVESFAQFSVAVNSGLSGLMYDVKDGKSKILPNMGFELGFTRTFSKHWGFVTGIAASKYGTDSYLNNNTLTTQNQVDDVGSAFEYRIRSTEYKETQRLTAVGIPLLVQYRTGNAEKTQWFINGGVKVILPFDVNVKASAQQLDLSGYYPDVNLEIKELSQHGFGTVYNWESETNYSLKPTVAASLATGVSFYLQNGCRFSIGLYGNYGINDMRRVTDMPLVTYNAPLSKGAVSNCILSSNNASAVRLFDAGIQLKFEFGRKKKIIPPPVYVAPDGDKDGVPDNLDLCPCKAGCTAFRGCPDTDGDGIPDNLDKCPDVKGLEKYNGCPIPDKDKDGINDEEDKCPDEFGLAKYKGCPIPDTDGDGMNDEEDKCPTIKGTRENNGCPEIAMKIIKKANIAAENIFFETGTATLRNISFKGLDEVIKILKETEGLRVYIDGHTDIVGSDGDNQVLSESRAKSVQEYLVKGGIDANRLTATGYGKTRPVSDNTTDKGRQQNRRVELKLSYN